MAECINCKTEATTPHCPNCGQQMEVSRVTFKGMMLDFFSRWIGFDNQFGRTVKDLLFQPGVAVNSYLQGNRVRYIGPLGYLVIMTAMLIVSFDVLGLEVQDFLKQNQNDMQPLFEVQELSEEQRIAQQQTTAIINEYAAKYYRFLAVAIIPFWALSIGWFYRKEKLNYVERLVITSFLSCEGIWLNIVGLIIFSFTGQLLTFPMMILSMTYYIYAINKVFPGRGLLSSSVKTILSMLAAFVMFFIVISIFGALFISKVIQNP